MTLLVLLLIKHFVADFPLQAFPYQYKNKGTYGHPGGLLHAGIHVNGTLIVCLLVGAGPLASLAAALFDGVVHYHVDWAKMNLNARWELTPTTTEGFWMLLGFDQFLHQMTYVMIVIWLS